MSKTVDERVVEMRFDNGQFERNVKTTLTTLDKLKAKLNLTGASKGLQEVQQTANKMSFVNVESSLGFLEKRFSTMGIVGMTVIQNLTTSFMGFASKLTSFATGGIIEGGLRRATNLQNAKFQLQGLLKDGEKVAKVMKDVNYGVQDTAYSLDAAANVAAQLAASGLEAGDKMKAALRGVSGVAAMTNSSYEEIGNVFTKVAGQGRVMADDLNSLAARGMNAAATLGQALGKSEAEIRDMVSKGKISFDIFAKAMDDAFGEHAKEANRTMNGALSNIRAALAKIGAEFFEPIIKMDGPLVNMLNAIRERINDIKADIIPFLQDLSGRVGNVINNIGNEIRNGNKMKYNPFYEGLENDGKTKKYVKSMEQIQAVAAQTGMTIQEVEQNIEKLNSRFLIFNSIKNIGEGIATVFKSIGKAFSEVFGGKAQDSIFNFAAGLNKITTIIKDKLVANADKIYNTFKGLFSILSFGINVIKGIATVIGNLLGSLFDVSDGILSVTSAFGKWISDIHEGIKKTNAFNVIITKLGEFIRNFTQGLKDFLHGFVNTFGQVISSVAKAIGGAVKRIFTALGNAISSGDAAKFMDLINKGIFSLVLLKIKNFINYLGKGGTFFDTLKRFANSLKNIANNIAGVLNTVKCALQTWQNDLKAKTLFKIAAAVGILALALVTLSDIDKDKLKNALSAITTLFVDLVVALKVLEKGNVLKNASKYMSLAISLSLSVLILASALKKIATLDTGDLMKGVIAIFLLMKIMTNGINKIAKSVDAPKVIKGALGIIALAVSIRILASACKALGDLDLTSLAKGVGAIIVLLAALAAFIKFTTEKSAFTKIGDSLTVLTQQKQKLIQMGISMILIASAMKILASACKDFASLSWENCAKGLIVIAALLQGIGLFLNKTKNFEQMIKTGIALNILAIALKQIAKIFLSIATLSWGDVAKGIVAMGAALYGMVKTLLWLSGISQSFGTKWFDSFKIIFASQALSGMVDALKKIAQAFLLFKGISLTELGVGIIAIASSLYMLTKTMEKLKGQDPTALILCSFALMVLAKSVVVLAGAGIFGVATGLLAFAGVFTILGLAAKLLKPHISTMFKIAQAILALSGSFAVLGLAMMSLGVGLGTFTTSLIAAFLGFKLIGWDTIIKGLIGIASAFVIIGVAAHVLKPMIGSIFALAGAIAVFSLSVAAMGVGVSLIVQALATMAAVGKEGAESAGAALKALVSNILELIPIAIKQLGLSLKELLIIIKDMIPLLGEILIDTVHTLVQVLITCAAEIVEGFFESIVQALTMLNKYVPTIANLLFDFMINVLNTLSIRLPEFVTAVINFLARLFDAVVQVFSEFGAGELLKAVVALGVLTIVMKLMAGLVHIVPQAMLGILAFGVLITELAAVISAVGALSRIPGFKELVTDGGNFLQIIGTAIGQFVGGIAGGIAKGFSSSMPEIATNLSEFMKNLEPFIAGARLIDGSVLAGVSILADTIVKLIAAGFLDSITEWITGSGSLSTFSVELVAFGKGLKEFSNAIQGLNASAIIQASKAADGLVELSNKLPNRGGLSQFFGGKKSLKIFGGELEAFGKGLKEFSNAIVGLNVENINVAIDGADKLIELSNKVPARAGMGNWFAGKKSLKLFGGELEAFADGLLAFSNKVAGLNVKDMYTATNAADVLVDLTNKLPNRAGMGNWFVGKKSLKLFGGELEAFGNGIKSFTESVKDINVDSMNKALSGADKLVDLTNKVPNRAGMANWFGGKKSLEIFGGELKAFGKGLKEFCEETKDIKMNNMTDVLKAVETLSKATGELPDINGKKLENRAWGFGYGIWHIAEGLSGFCEKLNETNFNVETITNAVNAVKTLSEVFDNLPDKDGGKIENRGWGLGTAIDHFANGISSFINKLNGTNLDPDYISKVANSIKTMAEAINTLPDKDGGKIENRAWGLGCAIGHFANGFSYLMTKLNESNYDKDKIDGAAESIKTMAEAVNTLPDKDGGKIENRAWGLGCAIGHFGNGLKSMANGLNESNFDAEKMKSAAEVVKVFSEAVQNLPDKDGGKIENRAWGLGCAIGHFGNGLKSMANGLNESNFDAEKMKSAADVVRTFGYAVNDLPDKDGGKIENRAWGLGCAIGHFGNGLKSLSNSLNESNFNAEQAINAASVVRTFGEIFNTLPDKDGGTIENRAWGLGYGMTHFGNGLKDFCAGIANSVFDKVPTAIDYIKQFSEIVPVIPENAGTRLAGFGAGISDLGSKFGLFLESINGLDFSNVDASFKNIKKLLESLDSVSNFNVENISAVGEAIKTVGEALNNLANIPNDISTKFNDALSTLGQNGMTSFLNAFSTIESDMNGKGLDAITGFTSGINNNQSTATDALVNLHNACKEKIKTDEYETIGKNVVEGFARGISNNTKLATDAMSIMTAKVEAQARQDLDINSPSKLFRKIGSGVPEGFAQGISMFKDSIKKSVTNMSNSAIDSTRNVIAKISNIINSDVDNTMTLRPILDLSNVEDGVATMNGMFRTPSIEVMSNLNAISTGMRTYRQNGGEDIVSAIDKLGKSLGNTNGDTYNINGITYDNGSEIQEAVSTLVRAARIERRT